LAISNQDQFFFAALDCRSFLRGIDKEMKAAKRFFGRKKKKKSTSSSADTQIKSQPPQPRPPKPNADLDTANDKPIRKKTTNPFGNENECGDEKPAAEKNRVKSLVNKESMNNQKEVKGGPVVQHATRNPSGDEARKRISEEDRSPAKTPIKNREKKVDQLANTNGGSPSLIGKKIEDVVVPQCGKDNRHATIGNAYDSIALLEQTKLPRGGISIETAAIGRVQFGIPPETIKDSMQMGIPVPEVYIVPTERFCRDMGPGLGVNLAEFEFPCYFNYFIRQKNCTLVVDSQDAEDNICRVFEETLLGPKKFRRGDNSAAYEVEDFAPDYLREAIPNFTKELGHFREQPGGKELCVGMMLAFCHFKQPTDGLCHDKLGVPPNLDALNDDEVNQLVQQDYDEAVETADEFQHEIDEEDVREILYKNKEVPKIGEKYKEICMGKEKTEWSYGKASWVGDVATVWPKTATEEEKKNRSVPRVEIFKMPSGTEYIIHDVNVDNIVVGRARFSGSVKVNESLSIEGFEGKSILDDSQDGDDDKGFESFSLDNSLVSRVPPSFYPPSFGVTILGNSHGFDPSGSVSGYVLWINGRGVMIDPPPYATATLEREGIRPRTIVGIILTHVHSDHDAGAFQKVLTGSPVVVITTRTIYKSFIRKYAALASLSPALLKHCHRYKPAIIGEDLRFQGATFKFFYSLHSIPCVGFRVEWRGRSMVFSGDHLNIPEEIDKLEGKGVLSKARADIIRNMPLQETDLLLHEAGVPPLHTPFAVLDKLPKRVKKHMYIVHSAKIPDGFDLRKAPTGTAGTLRLDELPRAGDEMARCGVSTFVNSNANRNKANLVRFEDEGHTPPSWENASTEYLDNETLNESIESSSDAMTKKERIKRNSMIVTGKRSMIPLVSMRPSSNTDSWYMLNLLQAVPFITSLPYRSTMEVLETTRVDAFCKNDVIVPAARRKELLCVIWEGTCVEREPGRCASNQVGKKLSLIGEDESYLAKGPSTVWHSGDWTGPLSLQPEKRLSGESESSAYKDIVATSKEGVKVITLEFKALDIILKAGSPLYRQYLKRQKQIILRSEVSVQTNIVSLETKKLLDKSTEKLNILELIDMNSTLRKLTAVQKRHLECLAQGPVAFNPGERLWRAGAPVDEAFIVVAGTASFVVRRRTSFHGPHASVTNTGMLANFDGGRRNSKGESEIGLDFKKIELELGDSDRGDSESEDDKQIHFEQLFGRSKRNSGHTKSLSETDDFDRLSKTLMKRAESLGKDDNTSIGDSHDEFSQSSDGQINDEKGEDYDRRSMLTRRRSSKARFVNKTLVRLYDRRTFTGGLVFSRGHFLGDVSKMVAGLLGNAGDASSVGDTKAQGDEPLPSYGFGEKVDLKGSESEHVSNMVIHEKDGEGRILHTSTLTAGSEGCVVLLFPRETLTGFLEQYPGLLLSLLGAEVIT